MTAKEKIAYIDILHRSLSVWNKKRKLSLSTNQKVQTLCDFCFVTKGTERELCQTDIDFIIDVAKDINSWGFIIDDYFGEETLNQTEE